MSRRILKFVVWPSRTAVDTADEPRWLAVGTQGEEVVVWCEATPGQGVESVLTCYMTGQNAPPADETYIGTTQVGPIVVHVYRNAVTRRQNRGLTLP